MCTLHIVLNIFQVTIYCEKQKKMIITRGAGFQSSLCMCYIWSIIWSKYKDRNQSKLYDCTFRFDRLQLKTGDATTRDTVRKTCINAIKGAKPKFAFRLRLGRNVVTRASFHFKSVYLFFCVCGLALACVGRDILHHCNPTIPPHLSPSEAAYHGQLMTFTR